MHIDKKMLVLPILIMMAFAILGFAIAHWSDVIYINGTVHMGSMTLAFKEIEPPVEYKRLPDGTLDPTEGGKPWVCNTTSYLTRPIRDVHTNKTGYEKLWINITNAYPCYEVHQTFILHNIGSIALDVIDYNITDPTGTLVWVRNTTDPTKFRGDLVDNSTGLEIPIINIEIVNSILPQQYVPCQENKMEIDIHIKQEAKECHTYYFEVGIVYVSEYD